MIKRGKIINFNLIPFTSHRQKPYPDLKISILPVNILGYKEDWANKDSFPPNNGEFQAHGILMVI